MSNKEANLIINSQGAVYHLGLEPEDICPIIITAGDPDRVSLIASHLDYKEKEISHREFHSVKGYLGTSPVLIISTGMGSDNIDIVMTELHTLYLRAVDEGLLDQSGIKFIRLGTSGTIHAEHPLDSVLISSNAIGLDNVPSFYKTKHSYLKENESELPYYHVSAPGELWKAFLAIPSSTTGTTLTCAGFYGPQFRSVHLSPTWDLTRIISHFQQRNFEVSNMEMETAAIYFFASELGHQAASINALIADRLLNRFSDNPEAVISSMIHEAIQIIKEL